MHPVHRSNISKSSLLLIVLLPCRHNAIIIWVGGTRCEPAGAAAGIICALTYRLVSFPSSTACSANMQVEHGPCLHAALCGACPPCHATCPIPGIVSTLDHANPCQCMVDCRTVLMQPATSRLHLETYPSVHWHSLYLRYVRSCRPCAANQKWRPSSP